MLGTTDISWFKRTFGAALDRATAGSSFDADQLTAIACQETGYIWSVLRKAPGMPLERLLELCVGDTIDYKGPGKGRQAFPRNKAELLAYPDGQEMFALARGALVDMAAHVPGYAAAAANPDKFCRGFGLFQRDLQFFKVDPRYFLERSYASFEGTLAHALAELDSKAKKLGFPAASRLSDDDFCKVAIAYNTGGYKPSKGLKQGYFDGSKYYGEYTAEYLSLARSTGAERSLPPGRYDVIARPGLNLRKGPGTDFEVDRLLATGTQVWVVANGASSSSSWAFVDLENDGAIDGCVFGAFLSPSVEAPE